MDVSRLIAFALFASLSFAQQQPQKTQEPPEEDESLRPKEYAFNPLQASKEITVGNFYLKKNKLRAAGMRFEEATRWDPTNAEAFLRLGETREKLKDNARAKEAFTKYLELAPDSKAAPAIKKKYNLP